MYEGLQSLFVDFLLCQCNHHLENNNTNIHFECLMYLPTTTTLISSTIAIVIIQPRLLTCTLSEKKERKWSHTSGNILMTLYTIDHSSRMN